MGAAVERVCVRAGAVKWVRHVVGGSRVGTKASVPRFLSGGQCLSALVNKPLSQAYIS